MSDYIKAIEKDLVDPNRFLKMRSNKLLLTERQINIMDRFNIKWQNYNSYKGLVFEIEEILEDTSDEELEELSRDLQELSYYHETRK